MPIKSLAMSAFDRLRPEPLPPCFEDVVVTLLGLVVGQEHPCPENLDPAEWDHIIGRIRRGLSAYISFLNREISYEEAEAPFLDAWSLIGGWMTHMKMHLHLPDQHLVG
jgi:hypothetical protein